MGFLDTSARNPDITIAGITLALQFGNAFPIILIHIIITLDYDENIDTKI